MANATADGGGGPSANTPIPTPVTAPVDGESSAAENLSTTQTNPDSAMQDHADLGSPSPLSGAYLLIVLPEPHCEEHKDVVLKRLHKALLSWDVTETQVDIDRELLDVATQAPQGEESKNGEKLIQLASDSLVVEILIHPEINTFRQCLRNLLASFTRHRHIIHMGYTLSGSGSWILQDGTFEFSEFLEIVQDTEVQRLLRVYDGAISLDIHCAPEGQWGSDALLSSPVAKSMKIALNPPDKLDTSAPGLSKFIQYMCDLVPAITIEKLLEPSDVVGNIRFSHPTLYVFPAGQGDAALFGISGFNILVDGGFGRKPCFWDFARHMDRLDAVLMTRANMSSLCGLSSAISRKAMNPVYPQMGHVFCNIPEVDGSISPEGLKDKDPLIVHVMDVCQVMANSIKSLHMTPQPAYRENSIEPVNLYHKVGHGTLDMYVISPQRDSKEVKEFLHLWKLGNAGDLAAARGSVKLGGKDVEIPLLDLVSICALVVWQPADPTEPVTRILFPGSAPQQKILEGFQKLRHLDFLRLPACTGSKLAELSPVKAKSKPVAEKSEKKVTTTPRPVMETVEVKQVKSVSAAPKKLDLEEKLNKINEAKSAAKTDSRETISKSEKKEKDNEKVKEAAKPTKKAKAAESSSTEEKPPTPRPKTEIKSRVDSNLATAKADSMELKKKAESKPVSKPKPPAEKAAAPKTESTPKANQIAPKIKKEVANMKVAEAKATTIKAVAKKTEEAKKKPEKPAAAEDKDKDKETKAAEKPKKKVRSKSKEKKSEEKEVTPKIKATEAPKVAKPKPKPAEVKEKPVKVKLETKKESTPPKEAKKETKEKPKAAKPAAAAAAPTKPKETKSKDAKAPEKKKTDAKPSAGSTQAKAVKRPPKPVENGTAAAAAAAAAVVVATAAGISAGETVAEISQETVTEQVFTTIEAPEAASAPPAAAAEIQENGEAEKVSLAEAVEVDIVADEVEMDKTDEREEEDEEKAQETSIDDVLEHETSTEDIKEHEVSTEEKVREDAEEVEDDEEKESTLSEDDLAKNDEEKEIDEEKEEDKEADEETEVEKEVDEEKEEHKEAGEETEVEKEVDEEKEEEEEEKEVDEDKEEQVDVDEEKELDEEKEEEKELEEEKEEEKELDEEKEEKKELEVDVDHEQETEKHIDPIEEDRIHEDEQQHPVEQIPEKTGLFSKLEKAVTDLKEVIGDALAKKSERESTVSQAAEEASSKTEVPDVPESTTQSKETIDLDFRQTVPELKGDVEDIVDHAAPASQEAAEEPKETRDVEEKDVDEVDDKLEHKDGRRESISSVHEEFQAEIITKESFQKSLFQDTGASQKAVIQDEIDTEQPTTEEKVPELFQNLQDQLSETEIAAEKHDEIIPDVTDRADFVEKTVAKAEQSLQDPSLEHEILVTATDREEILEPETSQKGQQELEQDIPAQETTFSSEIHVSEHKELKSEDIHLETGVVSAAIEVKASGDSVPESKEELKSKDLSPKEQNLEEIQAAIEMTGRKLLEDIVPHSEETLSTPELSPVVQKEEVMETLSSTHTLEHESEKIPESHKDEPDYIKASSAVEEVLEPDSGKTLETPIEHVDYPEQGFSDKIVEHDLDKSPVPQKEDEHYTDDADSREQILERDIQRVPEHQEETRSSFSCAEADILESKTGTLKEEEKLTGTSDIVQAATIHAEVPQTVDTYDRISPSDERSSEKSVSPAPHESQDDYIKNGVTPELSEPCSRGSEHGESRKDQSPSGMSLSAAFGNLEELQAQVSAASFDKQQQLHEEELEARVAEQLEYEDSSLFPRRDLSGLDKTQQHPEFVSPVQKEETKEQPIKETLSYEYESQKSSLTSSCDLSQSEQPESHQEPIKDSDTHEKQFELEQHVMKGIVPDELKVTAAETEDLHKTPATPRSDVSSESFTYEQQQQQLEKELDPAATATIAAIESEDFHKAPLTPRSDISSESLKQKEQLELEQHDEDEHSIPDSRFVESDKILTEETTKASVTQSSDVSDLSYGQQQHVEIQQPAKEAIKDDFGKTEVDEERIAVTPTSDSSAHEQQLDLQQHIKEDAVSTLHESGKPSEVQPQQHVKEEAVAGEHQLDSVAAQLEFETEKGPVTPRSDVSAESYVYEVHSEKESLSTALKTESNAPEQQLFQVHQHAKDEAAAAVTDLPAAGLKIEEEKLHVTGDSKAKLEHDGVQLDLQQHDKEVASVHEPDAFSAKLETDSVVAPPSPRSDISAGSHVDEQQQQLQQLAKHEPASLKVDIPAATTFGAEKELLTPRSDISTDSYTDEQQHKEQAAEDEFPVTPRSDAFEQQPVKEEIFSANLKTEIQSAKPQVEEDKVLITPRSDVSADLFGYVQPLQRAKDEAAEAEHKSDILPVKVDAEKSEVPPSPRSDVSAESFHYEQHFDLQQHGKEETITSAYKSEQSASILETSEERTPDVSFDSHFHEEEQQHDLEQHAKEDTKTAVDKFETLAAKLDVHEEIIPASPRSDVSTETYSYEHQVDLQQHSAVDTLAAAHKAEIKIEAGDEKAPISPRSDVTSESCSYDQQQLDLRQHGKQEAVGDIRAVDAMGAEADTKEESKPPLTPRSDASGESYIHEERQIDLQQHSKVETAAARKTEALITEVETDEQKIPLTPRSDVSVESYVYEQQQQLDLQQHSKSQTAASHEIDTLTSKPVREEEKIPLTPRSDVSTESYIHEEQQQLDLQQHSKEETAAAHKTETLITEVETEQKIPLTPRSDISVESYVYEQQLDLQQHSKEETAAVHKTETLIAEVETDEQKIPLTPRSDVSVESYVYEQQQQLDLQQHSKGQTAASHEIDMSISKPVHEEEKIPLTPRSDVSSESYTYEERQQLDLQQHSKEGSAAAHQTDALFTKEEATVILDSDVSSESYVQEQQQQPDLQQHSKEETTAAHNTEKLITKQEDKEEKAPVSAHSDVSTDSHVLQQQQQHSKEETASASHKTDASASKLEYEEEKAPLTPRSDISVEDCHYEQHFDSQQHAEKESLTPAPKLETLTGKIEPEDVKGSPRSDISADSSAQQHQFDLQQHSKEETVAAVHKPEALATKSDDVVPVSPRSDISGDSFIYEKQQHAKEEAAPKTTNTDTLGDKLQQEEHQAPPSPRSDVSSEPFSLEQQQQHAKIDARLTLSKHDAAAHGQDQDEKAPVTPRSDISTDSYVYDRQAKEEILPAATATESSPAKAEKETEKAPLTPRSDISGDSYVYDQQAKKEAGLTVHTGAAQLDTKEEQLPVTPRSDISAESYVYEQQAKKEAGSTVHTGAAQLDTKEEQLPITPRSDISAESYVYEQRHSLLQSDSKEAKLFETEVSSQSYASAKDKPPTVAEADSASLKSGFSSSTSEAAWLQSSEQFPASAYSYSQDYDRDLERREFYPDHPTADFSATYTEEYTTTTETEDWQHYGHEQDPDPNYRYEQHYDESYPHAYDDSYGYEDPYAAEYHEEHASEPSNAAAQAKESDPAAQKDIDPLASWGKPLGLPAPIPPVAINGHDSRKSPNKKTKSAKPQEKQQQQQQQDCSFYVDLAYVPHHANPNYCDADFFKRIKARHYVLSALEPSTQVLNALVEAKESWSGDDKDLDVTIIPTYDSDALGLWVSSNEETLARNRIDLAPSASRCTINLQDHETACSAYRLEF